MELGISQTFSAAHKLPNYVGNCANLHGHTWKAIIEIDAEIDPDTGMVVDYRKIKEIVNQLDHKYLNDLFENPTCELVCEWLVDQIVDEIKGTACVKLYESESTWCKSTKYSTA